jgi:hypothetical protein
VKRQTDRNSLTARKEIVGSGPDITDLPLFPNGRDVSQVLHDTFPRVPASIGCHHRFGHLRTFLTLETKYDKAEKRASPNKRIFS